MAGDVTQSGSELFIANSGTPLGRSTTTFFISDLINKAPSSQQRAASSSRQLPAGLFINAHSRGAVLQGTATPERKIYADCQQAKNCLVCDFDEQRL